MLSQENTEMMHERTVEVGEDRLIEATGQKIPHILHTLLIS